MPEGDTIYRAARTLRRALAGRVVTAFESMFPALTRVHDDAPITGRVIEAVAAAGKHLLITFSGGLVLRTHMRMNGSWHIYRPGERWQRPRGAMRIVVATDRYVAVGFSIPIAEFVTADRIGAHAELSRLGPDLLADAFDPADAIARLRGRGDRPIADVLLNQRVVAGIGNVYKSEVLFLAGVNPWTPVRALSNAQVESLVTIARTLLRANVLPSVGGRARGLSRITTRRDDPAARLWVYGRGGKPCRRCGTSIAARKTGLDARLTYWCETCQPACPAGDGRSAE